MQLRHGGTKMELTLKGANVYVDGHFELMDLTVNIDVPFSYSSFFTDGFVDFSGKYIFPGFADVHVHLREPGFSYKETVKSGTQAGAAGGYTALCSMPNLKPPPDGVENLEKQLEIIRRDAEVAVLPYGTITVGQLGQELSEMEAMSDSVCGFSDDGKGVQNRETMKAAMLKAKSLGKMIVAHCEDESLLHGGYIHDGEYAKAHGHRGICSESEWGPIERDIELVKETGCAYHVCHISTKESVDIIRKAKAEGVNITCETGPHYLTLCDNDLQEHGRFKMNPPLRSATDRDALIEGLIDGTIDMIATDHAPHSEEEKGRGLEKSAMGVVGLETAFPVLYTELVKKGVITLEKLIYLMSQSPRSRFDIDTDVGFTVYDLDAEYEVNPDNFVTMGRATPFEGKRVFGKCLMTVYNGKMVYKS